MTRLTDLVYFSIQPDKSGELELGHLDQPSFEELRQLTRKNKVRLSICVGGWGRSQGFSPMAPDQNLRQDFIHQLKNFCLRQDLDGVDFDWEFPQNREEVIAYEKLLVETKAAFQQHRLLVTVAVGHHMCLSSPIYEAIDYIHLMSYDHSAQYSTYRESLSDVAQQLEFGVPAKKLCLGIPFYGRAVENWHQATAYTDLVKQFHPSAKANMVNGIYFNGRELVRRKVRYALQKGLADIIVWEIGQAAVDKTSLLKTINQTLNR